MKKVHMVLIGCGSLLAFFVILIIALVIWLASGPEGGVRLSNEMEPYAVKYIKEHKILKDSEDIVAYYDVTVSMDSTEAAILTTKRLIYHNNGKDTVIDIADIDDIQHSEEILIGDILVVSSASGQNMKIEIAPLNQGNTFVNLLKKSWTNAKKKK